MEEEFSGQENVDYLPQNIAKNIAILTESMGLNKCEKELLTFYLIFEYDDMLSSFAEGHKVAGFYQPVTILSNILGVDKDDLS